MWKNNHIVLKTQQMLAKHETLIVFDTETTGLHAQTDYIIELSAKKYRVDGRGNLEELASFQQFMKPPFYIEQNIQDLTGITNWFLQDKPSLQEAMPDIQKFFGTDALLVGYNVEFDIRFLQKSYERCGLTFSYADSLDVLQMARERIRKSDIANYKLGTVAKHLGADKGVIFHSAMGDVEATARIFTYMAYRYLRMKERPTKDLIRPNVFGIGYWQGYRGEPRIYVNTDHGSVYYDIRAYGWQEKDADMKSLDMDYVEQQAWKLAGASSQQEFAAFTGKLPC